MFPYVPPHPANSDPGREHRYLFTLLKQPKGQKIHIDMEVLTAKAAELRRCEKKIEAVWRKMLEGEGERRMSVRMR